MTCASFSAVWFLFSSLFHFWWPSSDMEVKSLNKRTSGQAFEVILKSPTDLSPDRPQSLSLGALKKEPSLGELQKKLEAAEERRRVRITRIINHKNNNISQRTHWLKVLHNLSDHLPNLDTESGEADPAAVGWETGAREGGSEQSPGGQQQLQQECGEEAQS